MPPRLEQYIPVLAGVSGTLGQVDAGLSMVVEALALAEQTGVRWYEAETYRIQGTLLLHQAVPDATQAKACFQQALAIARHQPRSFVAVAGQAPGGLRPTRSGARLVHRGL